MILWWNCVIPAKTLTSRLRRESAADPSTMHTELAALILDMIISSSRRASPHLRMWSQYLPPNMSNTILLKRCQGISDQISCRVSGASIIQPFADSGTQQ